MAKAVGTGPKRKDAGGGGAVGAVARNIVWERQRRRCGRLVGNPLRSVDFNGALGGSAPGANLFLPLNITAIAVTGRHRVVRAFCIPCGDSRVPHGVAQGEEDLHVVVQRVVIAGGDKCAIGVRFSRERLEYLEN